MEAAAHQNSTTTATMVAKFAISTLSNLLPILLFYAIELAKLMPSLVFHLLKFVYSNLLSSLDEILPPGRRIETLHHYLITTRNELEPVVKAYVEYLLEKYNEIYPLVKKYILIKLEDSIRFSEGCSAYLLTKFDEILPPGRRIKTLRHYLITTRNELEPVVKAYFEYLLAKYNEIYPIVKKYVLIKLEDSIRFSEGCSVYLLTKFDEAFPPGERMYAMWKYMEAGAIKSGDWTMRLKGYVVQKLGEAFGVEEEKVEMVVTLCFVVAIGLIFLRLCCCGSRSKMMKAPESGGARMRRSDFEGNPGGYFTNLRSRS